MDVSQIDAIVDKYGSDPSGTIGILLDIQEAETYLSKEALTYVADKLGIPVTQLYRMATFYEGLSLKPRGRHQIHVCTGTACHVRGAKKILETLERDLGIKPGETTPDLEFGLKTVNCLGGCALGPLVVVDGEYHGNMTPVRVTDVIKRYRQPKGD